MTPLFAIGLTDLAPFIVFAAIVTGAWFLMNALSRRTSRAEERLDRLGRGQAGGDVGELDQRRQRFSGLKDAIASIGGAGGSQTELERNKLKLRREGSLQILVSPQTAEVLRMAKEEADQMGDRFVGVGAMFLALHREPAGLSARILRDLGFRYELDGAGAPHYQHICPPCRRALFGLAQGALWEGR